MPNLHPDSELLDASTFYSTMFSSRSEEELRQVAKAKRLLERYTSDAVFRARLDDGASLDELSDRWAIDAESEQFLSSLASAGKRTPRREEAPLVGVHRRFQDDLRTHRNLLRSQGGTAATEPRFHAWRMRQIARLASEAPTSADSITFPIAAFELSMGCSIGCWFCGVSADRFSGHVPYRGEHVDLWRGILREFHGRFGNAARTGICYWATDPADNPDYVDFILDYQRVTGHLPQTSTAAPFKNPDLTRRLMELSNGGRTTSLRFSVGSIELLDRIHGTFSDIEMVGVELACQNRESLAWKASSGRARSRKERVGSEGSHGTDLVREEHATIACVSGFLINMAERSIRLVSPARACSRWPLGYRVHDRREFRTPEDFHEAIDGMIACHMPESIPLDRKVAFRDDLEFQHLPGSPSDRFQLGNAWSTHCCGGPDFALELGERISDGGSSGFHLVQHLVAKGNRADQVESFLQQLHDNGFLDDSTTGPSS